MAKTSLSQAFLNTWWWLIGLIIIILILVTGYFLLIVGDLTKISVEQKQVLAEAQAEKERTEAELSDFKKIQEQYQVLQSEQKNKLKDLEEMLPQGAKLPELMLQMEGLVKASGYKFSGVTFSPNQSVPELKNNKIKAVTFALEFAEGPGGYSSLKKLLNNIEQHTRILDLLSLSYGAGQEATTTSYSLNLRTYYWE